MKKQFYFYVSLWLSAIFFTLGLSNTLAQTAVAPTSGDGSSDHPYEIANLNNLYWIAASSANWSLYYIQTADIDASLTSAWDDGDGGDPEGWTPIGNTVTAFTGSYDGSGHTINGLYISRTATDNQGLFGITQGCTIKNLGVTGVQITGKQNVGGMVGYTEISTKIYQCYMTGSISGTANVAGCVGLSEYTTIGNSYSTCSVVCSGGGGGFMGFGYYTTITNSYSTGSVSGSSGGGFIQYAYGGTVSNSFWDKESSGYTTSSGGTAKTTSEMKTLTTFTDATWDFVSESDNGSGDYWDMDQVGTVNNGYPILCWQSGADSILPVELVSFTCTVQSANVELAWQTATEINNYGFEIERTTPLPPPSEGGGDEVGGGSESKWVKIGFITGSGTSNSPKEYSFTDDKVTTGNYKYRLKQIDNDGRFEYSDEVEVNVTKAAADFALQQNYPNPFNPSTLINYTLPQEGHVVLKLYDILGKEVATLVDKQQSAGTHSFRLSSDGFNLAAGVYVYELQSGSFTDTKKMLLLK